MAKGGFPRGMGGGGNMNQMIKQNTYWQDIEIDMAGKTGTAEETGVPSHALFIGYAPYDNPEIAIACRITNGYTSANASLLAKDMIPISMIWLIKIL